MAPSVPRSVVTEGDAYFASQRRRMVAEQLQRRGINDPRVLAAMNQVPRHAFVESGRREDAYRDYPLEIGGGQTISQPFTVAFMAQALQLQGSEKVLEIGTGSGYAAAVLACLAADVHTVERLPQLAHAARRRLEEMQVANVQVHFRDGTLGLPEYAPFDAIVVAAGASGLPQPYLDQLACGGRLVIPIDEPGGHQMMYRFTRQETRVMEESLGRFVFVPLIQGAVSP